MGKKSFPTFLLLLAPERHYKEKLQRRCCKDGLREIPMPYSCTRRSLYITEGWECIRAFRYCCATYRNEEFNTAMPTTVLPTTQPPTTTAPLLTHVAMRVPLNRHIGRTRVMGNSSVLSLHGVDFEFAGYPETFGGRTVYAALSVCLLELHLTFC